MSIMKEKEIIHFRCFSFIILELCLYISGKIIADKLVCNKFCLRAVCQYISPIPFKTLIAVKITAIWVGSVLRIIFHNARKI